MALSGSLTKKYFYSNTHCHWIEWTATQNIANNQSTVTVSFKSTWTSGFGTYSESKNVNQIRFNGTNYTRSTSITGSVGTVTQFSTTQVITHNTEGKATFKLGGRHRLNSSYGDYVYWNDVTFTLDTIPRTSSIGTISGSTIGSNVTVNINAASTAFSHKYEVRFPNTSTSKLSGNVAAGVKSFSFTPAMAWCNDIPNSTSGTARVYVDTYSGSTKIGGTSKSFTLNVPASVKPTINTSASTATEGNSAVSAVTGKFVQSLSRLTVKLSASGAYGSTITKREIKANGQTLTTTSNTATKTTTAIKNSGNNSVVYTVTDSRGRTASYTRTVSVEAYSTPKITKTITNRASPDTTVKVAVTGSWTSLGGDNRATFSLARRPVGGSASSVVISPASGTTGSLNTTYTVTGNDALKSYTYTFKITDSFGYVASASATVGTAFQELTIRPGVGVGIGKIHENGALDVGGDIYARGGCLTEAVRITGGSLNDIKTIGLYQTGRVVDSANISDKPNNNASIAALLIVLPGFFGINNKTQILINHTGSQVWLRTYYSEDGTWYPWRRITTTVE